MKLDDYVDVLPIPEPGLEQRIWGAKTDDHWFLCAVLIRPLGCNESPSWLGFDFQGAGKLGNVNVAWAMGPVLARIACRLERLVLREVPESEYREAEHAAAEGSDEP